jgi:pimeloyl-ACP methyl ester carboxylesterase
MNRSGLALVMVAIGGASCWVIACASDSGSGPVAPAGDSGVQPSSAFTLAVPCTDSIDSIYADPGPLPDGTGTILRCAKDTDISMSDLQAQAQANVSVDGAPATNTGYTGKPYTSGAHVYRVLFTTERGDKDNSRGYESAKVYLPDTPRGDKLPVVIGARGTRGQASVCAASKEGVGIGMDTENGDYRALAYSVVGFGMPIIIPDLAGYNNYGAPNNPISGYQAYKDVGKGTLDGGRALRKMLSSGIDEQTVIVGHSQGGHSAFSALAMAETYAPDLNIVAVATYAPLWFTARTWGAFFQVQGQYPINDYGFPAAVSVWYHYTHGELLDGPGHGVDVFAADKRDQIKAFVDTHCVGGYEDLVEIALGTSNNVTAPDAGAPKATIGMLYDPAFAKSVKTAAAFGVPCAQGDALCEKWVARYVEDRPHLTGKAASTPILITYGSADTTIPPERMTCGTSRLAEDKANTTFCLTPGLGHQGNVRARGDYVADWIIARTQGGPEPAACPGDISSLKDDAGTPIECATPPPND